MCTSKNNCVVPMKKLCNLQVYCLVAHGCKKVNRSKNDRHEMIGEFMYEMIGEAEAEMEL